MPPIEMVVEGGFYIFGSREGLKPVRVWVGHIDGPAELGPDVPEPVAHVMLRSMREGMPTLSHAPFALSALLSEPFQKVPPFDITGHDFDAQYVAWRKQWDAGEVTVWMTSPSDVYRDAMKYLVGKGKP